MMVRGYVHFAGKGILSWNAFMFYWVISGKKKS